MVQLFGLVCNKVISTIRKDKLLHAYNVHLWFYDLCIYDLEFHPIQDWKDQNYSTDVIQKTFNDNLKMKSKSWFDNDPGQ